MQSKNLDIAIRQLCLPLHQPPCAVPPLLRVQPALHDGEQVLPVRPRVRLDAPENGRILIAVLRGMAKYHYFSNFALSVQNGS